MRIAIGVVVALVELFVGALFDVNGSNWGWWQRVMFLLAVLTVALALGLRIPVPHRRLVTAVGIAVAVAALVVSSRRFNDSYLGTQLWPRLLACVFGAGLAAAEIAVSGASRRSRRDAS